MRGVLGCCADGLVTPVRDSGAVNLADQLPGLMMGLLLGVFADRLVRRRDIDTEARQRRREAADSLLGPLRWLRQLARSSRYDEPQQRAWAEAVVAFQRAYDDVEHLLPDGSRHLSRSVLGAVGEHAGTVMFADLDPRVVDDPPPPRSHEWMENTIGYLEYVVFTTQCWRDGSRSSFEPLRFDDWLRRPRM